MSYDDLQRVRISHLKEIKPSVWNSTRSPWHYQQYVLGNKKKESKDLEFGTYVHTYLLEPEKVQSEFLVIPGHEKLNQWAESQGLPPNLYDDESQIGINAEFRRLADEFCRMAISEKATEKAAKMIESVFADERSKKYFDRSGEAEKTVQWHYFHSSGELIEMKSRIDWLPHEFDVFVDFKTSRAETHRDYIDQEFFKFDTHIQLAAYMEATGKSPALVVGSKVEPYQVWTIEHFSEAVLKFASAELDEMIGILLDCRQRYGSEYDPANVWPGSAYFEPMGIYADLPMWLKKRLQ